MSARLPLAAVIVLAFIGGDGMRAGAAEAPRDGQHDFDFDLGTWHMHSRRLLHPLSGSGQWVEMNGVTVVRPVWGGRANIAEVETDGPDFHLELLALRLYDPVAHQWNINFATSKVGVLNYVNSNGGMQSVPMIGQFRDGKGVFYDQEPYEGRTIWVRFIIQKLSATTARSEQAFSGDNGKSWETNWINEYTKTGS